MSSLLNLSQQLGVVLMASHWYCTVAESCTGGGLAAAITETPGSSKWFDRGFITYSNRAKNEMLDVAYELMEQYGAVSEQTVVAMAEGALAHSLADFSVAVSGIAGPEGGTVEKPVGTVWLAWGVRHSSTQAECFLFQGNRAAVRAQSIEKALEGLIKLVGQQTVG